MAFGVKVKISPEVDAKGLRSKIQQAIEDATQMKPVKIRHLEVDLGRQEAARVSKQLESAIASQNLTVKIAKIDASKPVADLRKQLTTMLSGLSITGLKEFLGTDGVEDSYNRAENAANKLAEAQENVRQKTVAANASLKILNDMQKQLGTIFKSSMNINDPASLNEYVSEYERLTNAVQNAKTLEGAAQTEATTKITASVVALKQKVAAQQESERAAKNAGEAEKRAAAESERATTKEATLVRQAIQLRRSLNKWIADNPRAYEANAAAIDKMLSVLKNESKLSTAALAQVRAELAKIGVTAAASGIAGKTFFERLKDGWAKLGNAGLIAKSFHTIIRAGREVVSAVTEIDSAMTELRKVTNLTSQEYSEFEDSASNIARRVGASIADTINATADFSRLGYSVEEAAQLAEAALVYKNVGDGIDDISIATEALISTLKAFGGEAKDAMSVIDMFNEVGNNFAISSSGIGEALQRSAAALAFAGNSLEESIGLVVAMNSVVQNPEQVGTALKTLTMYIRAAKTEAEAAGVETEGMAASVSELRQSIMDLTGVDIMVDDTTFKSTYQIIKELSVVWDDLQDVVRGDLLEMLGGKRNANVIASLIKNFQDAERAMKTAIDSEGSAMKENARYLDSIKGKLTELKRAFEDLSRNVLDSSFLKGLIDGAITAVEVIDGLVNSIGTLPTAIGAVTIAMGLLGKQIGILSVSQGKWKIFGESFSVKGITETFNTAKTAVSAFFKTLFSHNPDTKALVAFNREFQNGVSYEDAFAHHMQNVSTETQDMAKAIKTGQASLQSFGISASAVSLKTTLVSTAMKVAAVAANAFINALASFGVSLAISKIVEWISSFSKAREEAERLAKEAAQAAEETTDSVTDTINEYLELVDALRDTRISQSEYQSSIYSLISSMTEQGESIDSLIAKYGNLQTAMREVAKQKLEDAEPALKKAASDARDAAEKYFDGFFNDNRILSNLYIGTDIARKSIGVLQEKGLVDGVLLRGPDKVSVSLGDSKELSTLKGFVDTYLKLGEAIKIVTDAAGTTNNPIFDALYKKYNEMKPLYDELISSYEEQNKNIASQLLTGIDPNTLPNTREEFEKFRDELIESAIASGEFISVTGDVETTVTGIIDAMLAESSWAKQFVVDMYDAGESTGGTETQIKGLAAAMTDLQKGYNLLATAKKEAENGGLSVDTIQTLSGMLAENEKLTDYLKLENGVLVLNAEKWQARSQAIYDADVKAIKQQITGLEDENRELAKTPNDAFLNSKKIEENEKKIAELNKELALYNDIYRDIVGSSIEADDPMNLSAMISDLENVGSKAKGLLSALKDLEGGTALSAGEMANLALQYEELFGMAPEYDLTTLEGQEAAIRAIIGAYEDEYDAIIETQIAELTAAKEKEGLTDAEVEAIQAKIDRLQALKDLSLGDIYGEADNTETKVRSLTDAINEYNTAVSMIKNIRTGDMLSALENIMTLVQSGQFKMAEFFDTDGLKSAEELTDVFFTRLIDNLKALAEAEGMTWNDSWDATLLKELESAGVEAEDTEKKVRSLTDAISEFNTTVSLIENIRAGDTLSALENIMTLVESGQFDIREFFDADGLKSAEELTDAFITRLLANLKALAEAKGMKWDDSWTEDLRKELESAGKEAEDTEKKVRSLSDTLSLVTSTGDFFKQISSGDSTVIEQIEAAIDLAESLKDEEKGITPNWIDWISSVEDGGATIRWSTEAIRALSDAQVDTAFATTGLAEKYPELIAQIKNYNFEANIAAEQADRMSEAYSNMQTALSSHSDYGGYTQITYENYQSLIEADSRYAAAVEYQNGIMVLNSAKHDELTAKILQETRAMAMHEKQTILMSDEYQKLVKLLDAGLLTDTDDLQRLLDLQAQIKGYDVLANEIDNATSAYYRWLNRKGDDGTDRYSQAQEAFELINATLNDRESEYYGRIGREEFGQAVDFVLGENVEVDTAEFDRAMALVKGYLEDGARGAAKFYDDLVDAELLDETTGALHSSIAEISNALGISEEMVRTMIDRLNEYQKESGKIKVGEADTSGAKETESQISKLVKTLEDSKECLTTLNETPINIQITDGDAKLEILNSFSAALKAINDCIQSIIASPMSFNLDDLAVAAETVIGHIASIRATLGESEKLPLDIETGNSQDNLLGVGNSASIVKGALDGIVSAIQAVMTNVHMLNSNTVSIKTGNSSSLLGGVSTKLSGIIEKLQKIKQNSNITVKINEVTTRTSSNSGNGSGGGLSSWWNGLLGRSSAGGTLKSAGGKTLVGELGMETVVDPHTNRWYTVGENGAEFVALPKDAIVFNHKQTKELFGTGRIDSRGEAMASGNAAASLWDNIVGGVKNAVDAFKNAIGVVAGAVAGVASDPTDGYGTQRPAVGQGKDDKDKDKDDDKGSYGGGGSSGGKDSSEEEETVLEKLQKKYEALDETLQHLIRHQEFLYFQAEKGLDYTGMENSLTEQANIYRKIMENASKAVEEMIANGASDSDKELQDMEEKYWQAYESLYGIFEQINNMYVDALTEKIDGIETAYSNLATAADEFNKYGGITVDSFQTLIANGVQYLSFLKNVDGQYIINEEAIQRMIAAEKEQLAIEQALSYIQQIQRALADEDGQLLANLVNLNNQISDSTWDIVYAQAAMLKAAGLTDEQYQQVIANINALQALSNQVTTQNTRRLDEAASAEGQLNQDRLDALNKILDLTQDLIKQEVEDQIDAIEDQIDAYKEIIDLKKESLRASKEENEYAKGIADKTKNIADLQARIDQLALDDSREAQAQRAALMEELAEAQSDLADTQNDHSYDLQEDALDKKAEEYELHRQEEIESLENSISSAEKLYQLAIQRLSEQWDTLYDNLIAWNYESGSTLQSEIVEAWKQAQDAVLQYGSYVQAVSGLTAATEDNGSGSSGTSTLPTVVATGTPYTPTPTPTNPSKPPANPALPDVPQSSNNAPNASAPGQDISKDQFFIDGKGRGKEGYVILKTYHSGGVAGDKVTLKDNEVLSTLEEGELILTDKMKKAAYKLIDFKDYLEKKLGNAIGSISAPFPQLPALAGVGALGNYGVDIGQMNFSPTIQVEINHSGAMTDKDARQYGKTIADTAMNELYEGFRQRGIGKIFGTKPTK